jgi:hypothetical protein
MSKCSAQACQDIVTIDKYSKCMMNCKNDSTCIGKCIKTYIPKIGDVGNIDKEITNNCKRALTENGGFMTMSWNLPPSYNPIGKDDCSQFNTLCPSGPHPEICSAQPPVPPPPSPCNKKGEKCQAGTYFHNCCPNLTCSGSSGEGLGTCLPKSQPPPPSPPFVPSPRSLVLPKSKLSSLDLGLIIGGCVLFLLLVIFMIYCFMDSSKVKKGKGKKGKK